MSAPKLKRWEILPSTGSHFDVLDGLRGVAILLVVSFHGLYVNPENGILPKLINWMIIQPGWMGVPIFFVLSGFLISYPFFKGRIHNPNFWWPPGYGWRRAAKIFPPFYLSIGLFIVFYYWESQNPAYLTSAWHWALGLGAYQSIPLNFNGVYWSLMVEIQFYLVLPVLFFLMRKISSRSVGILIFLLMITVPFLVRQQIWSTGAFNLPDFNTPEFARIWFKLDQFPARIDYFGWGVLFASVFASLMKADLDKIRAFSGLGYAGLVLMIMTLFFWSQWQDQFNINAHWTAWGIEVSHLLPALAAMLMLFFLFDPNCWGARLLSLKGLRFTGIISYEWFLFHGPVIGWFRLHSPVHVQGNIWLYLWKCVLPLLITFVFSALVYRYFSLPVLNRVRERVRPPAG